MQAHEQNNAMRDILSINGEEVKKLSEPVGISYMVYNQIKQEYGTDATKMPGPIRQKWFQAIGILKVAKERGMIE